MSSLSFCLDVLLDGIEDVVEDVLLDGPHIPHVGDQAVTPHSYVSRLVVGSLVVDACGLYWLRGGVSVQVLSNM